MASDASDAPSDLWTLTVVGAQIPPHDRSGRPWGGSGPDAFVKIFRAGHEIYESSTVTSLAPMWNTTLPSNVRFPRDVELRFELWARGMPSSHPIGIATTHGLPDEALPDANAVIHLEGGASITIKVTIPHPWRGCGIREVEQRADALVVVALEPLSPAGRAGLHPGDRITAVDSHSVAEVGPERATTALSMTAGRGGMLTVTDSQGQTRQTEIDAGYTWLEM